MTKGMDAIETLGSEPFLGPLIVGVMGGVFAVFAIGLFAAWIEDETGFPGWLTVTAVILVIGLVLWGLGI